MKRYLALGAAVLMLTTSNAAFTFAAGWSNNGGEWQYLNNDGQAVTDQWKKSGDGWYYLDEDGEMAVNSLIDTGDNLYYVDQEGRMVANRWVSFEADEDGNDYGYDQLWYYFGEDGKAYRKKNTSFKKKINGVTYAFDEDGIMLQGYLNDEGTWLDETEPFVEAQYYCGQDGAMLMDQWHAYSNHGGSDLESELAGRAYTEYDNMWLYFDSNGKKVAAKDTTKLFQKTINGKSYGFDENGVMISWWEEVATSSNASSKYFSGYDGGHLLKNTWFWMYPSESLSESAATHTNDYWDQECSWWRTDSSGKVIKNKIKKIGSKSYAFDDIGRMQTGFVLYDGKSTYVAQWDIDAWEAKDFVDRGSDLRWLGFEVSDLYLFSPDELNDGSMQTGSAITVELADGIHTFGFDSTGKAYGSRCQLVKKNDSYYFNGLRLEADEELKYGVIEISEGTYKVVDANGKIVQGSKKILKDGDGGWYVIIGNEFKAYISDDEKPRWHKGDAGEGYYRYDKDTKYGAFIANKDTAPDLSDLPAEALVFEYENVLD